MAGALGLPTRGPSNLDKYHRIAPCNSVQSDDSDGIFDDVYIYILYYIILYYIIPEKGGTKARVIFVNYA